MRVIIGPCAIESEKMLMTHAKQISQLKDCFSEFDFIFKACYNKANRSEYNSFHGIGIEEGLRLLAKVKSEFGLDVISDVHSVDEIKRAKYVLDYIQIPQSLARYSEIIEAAANTGLPLYIKNGVGMSPEQGVLAVEKAKLAIFSAKDVTLIERGYTFGHNDVVVDMRNFAKWRTKFRTCIDATHSALNRDLAPTILYAGIAAGADDIFIETHSDPDNALCDGKCMLKLDDTIYDILHNCAKLKDTVENLYK